MVEKEGSVQYGKGRLGKRTPMRMEVRTQSREVGCDEGRRGQTTPSVGAKRIFVQGDLAFTTT